MQGRQFSNDNEIARAGRKFLGLSLPKPEWTHAAHFAVTLWLMRHRPDLDLESSMPAQHRYRRISRNHNQGLVGRGADGFGIGAGEATS